MVDYLSRFLEEKVVPYKRKIQTLELSDRPDLKGTIDRIIEDNLGLVLQKRNSLFVPKAEEPSLESAYALTAELARELGTVLFGPSFLSLRMGEDFADVYSEIMSAFGVSKEEIKKAMLEALKPQIERDRLYRATLNGSLHHVTAPWN